jgi:carbonic anhydrase
MEADMKCSQRVALAAVGVFCLAAGVWGAGQKEAAGVAPDEAIRRLEEGNRRFVASASRAKERAALVQGQHPYAVVLTCADSRVPPEILFDEALGKLFVVRVAGNVVDPDVLGSIEYAVEHLHSHLLVVLGHDKCGAVQAALDGGTPPPDIAALISHITPAVATARSRGLDAAGTLNAAVRENAILQSRQATVQSELVAELVKKKELKIVTGVYHLDSGKIEWLASGGSSGDK